MLEVLGDLSRFQVDWVVYSQCQPAPSFSTVQNVAAGWIGNAELIASAGLLPGKEGEQRREKENALAPRNPVSHGFHEMQKGK